MNLAHTKWLQDLRSYEKKFQSIGAHPLHISQDEYTDCLALISSEAERLDFDRATKFLAKKYFDVYMANKPQEDPQNLLKVMICCLKVAVKVNQAPQISEQYDLNFCLAQSNNQYSKQDMAACEDQILDFLDYDFKITTPYDFLHFKTHLSPLEKQSELNTIFELVECTIDICGSFWESIHFLAEQIFFGCLLYCLKIKNRSEWNQLITQSTLRLTESKKICELVEEKISGLSM